MLYVWVGVWDCVCLDFSLCTVTAKSYLQVLVLKLSLLCNVTGSDCSGPLANLVAIGLKFLKIDESLYSLLVGRNIRFISYAQLG